jgi:hypothetical protein
MATRSKVLAYGTTAGTSPVSIYTCPVDVTAIVKYVGGGYEAGAPYVNSYAFLFYQPAGGPLIPFGSVEMISSGAGNWAAVQGLAQGIWQCLEPGDQLLISDDGTFTCQLVVSGAELDGVAP